MRSPADIRTFAAAALRLANRSLAPVDRLAERRGAAGTGAIFVVGLPRSGTTLVYELLVQAFDVAYLTRMSAFTFGLPSLTTRMISPFLGTPLPRYESRYGRIPGRLSPAENSALWARWFKPTADLGHYVPPRTIDDAAASEAGRVLASITEIAGRPFVFKNVYLTISIPALLATFPGARVLVVKRDFDAVCASVYNARLDSNAAKWWSIRPPFWMETLRRDLLEQVAFQCMRTDQILGRDLEGLSSTRLMTIDYEELCAAPATCLRRVADWAGSQIAKRPGATIPVSFEKRPSRRLPESELRRFAETCATLSLDRNDYLRRVDERAAQSL